MPTISKRLHMHARSEILSCRSLRSFQCGLEVVQLPLLPLGLALADNALAEPLSSKTVVELLEVLHDIPTAADDGVLGRHRAIRLNAELKGREERMWDLVGGKHDVIVLEQTLGEQVTERVILFVEREDCCVGYACVARVG